MLPSDVSLDSSRDGKIAHVLNSMAADVGSSPGVCAGADDGADAVPSDVGPEIAAEDERRKDDAGGDDEKEN